MPRKRMNKKNGNGSVRAPQKVGAMLNLTKFQPTRKILVASQSDLTPANPTKILTMSNVAAPGNRIGALDTLIESFESSRMCYVDVFFDQRGNASTAAVPRVSAWAATGLVSDFDPAKIVEIARFAGSGLNQIQPGRRFRIPIGPRFTSVGQFNRAGVTASAVLVITSQDYAGTIRFETCFEVIGPPIDYAVTP